MIYESVSLIRYRASGYRILGDLTAKLERMSLEKVSRAGIFSPPDLRDVGLVFLLADPPLNTGDVGAVYR